MSQPRAGRPGPCSTLRGLYLPHPVFYQEPKLNWGVLLVSPFHNRRKGIHIAVIKFTRSFLIYANQDTEKQNLSLRKIAWATRSLVSLLRDLSERVSPLGVPAGWHERNCCYLLNHPPHILALLPAPWGVSALSVMATLAQRKMRSPAAYISRMAREWPLQMNWVHPQEVGRLLPFPVYLT